MIVGMTRRVAEPAVLRRYVRNRPSWSGGGPVPRLGEAQLMADDQDVADAIVQSPERPCSGWLTNRTSGVLLGRPTQGVLQRDRPGRYPSPNWFRALSAR